MTDTEWKIIRGFAAMIEQNKREGAAVDMPEGTRRVRLTLSDTFAHRVTIAMRQAAGELQAMEALQATNTEQAEALEGLRKQINDATDPKIIVPRMN